MNCEMENQSVISTAVRTRIRRTVAYSSSGGMYSKDISDLALQQENNKYQSLLVTRANACCSVGVKKRS